MTILQSDFNKEVAVFTTVIPVLVNHLNYGNHLGYDSMLSVIQEARIRFLKQLGFSEISIEGNIGYLITYVEASYKSEVFHGEELQVEIFIPKIDTLSMELGYIVRNNIRNEVVSLCRTRHFFYNFEIKKLAKITKESVNLLKTKLL